MRLGGPIFANTDTPESWAEAAAAAGYKAAYCPVAPDADNDTVHAFAAVARKADIVIAEVEAWCNPLSPDSATAKAALEKCQASLALADRIGARCCVNIAGSRGRKWDGPDAADLTDGTFDMIVAMVRELLDTVNLVSSPQRYFATGRLIEECFTKLGTHIKSCHAKDILLRENLTVHLDEVRPGQGNLDYPVFLRELRRLDSSVPLMLEHLPNEAEYRAAAAHVRNVAAQEGLTL